MAEAEAAYEASEPSKDVSSHPDAKAEAPKLQYAELVTYLELRQASKSTVYSIPLALYAIVVALGALYVRASPWRSYPVEKAIIDNIIVPEGRGEIVNDDTPRTFGDIGSAGDVYDWLRDTIIPATTYEYDYNDANIDYTKGKSRAKHVERIINGAPKASRSGRVLGYNRLFFGVHVTQSRYNSTSCLATGLREFINDCYSDGVRTDKYNDLEGTKTPLLKQASWSPTPRPVVAAASSSSRRRAQVATPAPTATGGASAGLISTPAPTTAPPRPANDDDYEYNAFVYRGPWSSKDLIVDRYGGFWLPEFFSESKNRAMVTNFQDGSWIDLGTESVGVQFITINNEFDVMALTTMTVTFGRGGLVELDHSVTSQVIHPYTSYTRDGGHADDWKTLRNFESAEIGLLVGISIGFVLDVTIVGIGPWQVFDVLQFALIIQQRSAFAKIIRRTDSVVQDIQNMMNATSGAIRSDVRPEEYEGIFTDFKKLMSSDVAESRFLAFWLLLVLIFYTMKAVRHHPDYSLLIQTIVGTVSRGFSFIILMSVIVVIFTFGGTILFGHQVGALSPMRTRSCRNTYPFPSAPPAPPVRAKRFITTGISPSPSRRSFE